MSTDRNLLFGILALQMDFVSQADLVAAMNAWVLEKEKSLGHILTERGSLDDDTHALLEALVKKHLAQHDNDPQKSLQSLSSVGSLRDEVKEKLADEQLHASLAHVGQHHEAVEDPYATRARTMGESSSQGSRFKILRPHEKGGVGEVFVAFDEELQRQVALKEIQDQFADIPANRSRFVMEAEITGGLEHPGIVPVYGLGQYGDGRPFYAMRFIKGDSLKRAIERFHEADTDDRDPGERSLAVRELLRRFIDVCNAVAYAHSRGVLHRDLKPGNVMLGKYGETLVVDWGLAKVIGSAEEKHDYKLSEEAMLQPPSASGSEPTQMGSAIGTPAYMSPEQAQGRLDLLGPASDVYGLGATLYTLLTGAAPATGDDRAEVMRRVSEGRIRPPRQIKRSIPPALESICLKAIALEPNDRYHSPRELANDLEHWLADERVAAHPESLANRMARWGRRHRTWVRAAAAAMVLVAGVSVVAVILIDQSRRLAEDARGKEAIQRQRADESATAYRQQRDIALAAQQRAEAEEQRANENAGIAGQQRDLTLETLEKLVYDVQDKVGDKPGMQPLKEQLLTLAIEGLEQVARGIDVAAHEEEVAAVQREMGPEEIREYVKGFEQGRAAAIDHNLAIALRRMGDVFMATGRTTEAHKQFKNSFLIIQRLANVDRGRALGQQSLSNAHDKLGHVLRRMGSRKKAQADYLESLRIRESLAANDLDDPMYLYGLSVSLGNLGTIRRHADDYPAAFDYHRRAMRIRRSLVNQHPDDSEMKRALAFVCSSLGNLCLRIGLNEEAHDYYIEGLEVREALAALDPESRSSKSLLSSGYTGLGNALTKLGDAEGALANHLKRMEIAEEMLKADPDSLRAQRGMGLACNRLGHLSLNQGDVEAARDYFRREIEYAEFVARGDPDDIQWKTQLAASYSNLGATELRAGNLIEAAKWSAAAVLTEAKVRTSGKSTELPLLPDWIDQPLKDANPRRGVMRVLENPEFAEQQTPDVAKDLLIFRTAVLAARADIKAAATSARRIKELAGTDASALYDAARCYSFCADAAELATKTDEANGQQPDSHNHHVSQALDCLTKAIDNGYQNLARIKTDPDLTPLRTSPEYDLLVARLAAP